jgi:hypothetical protein
MIRVTRRVSGSTITVRQHGADCDRLFMGVGRHAPLDHMAAERGRRWRSSLPKTLRNRPPALSP